MHSIVPFSHLRVVMVLTACSMRHNVRCPPTPSHGLVDCTHTCLLDWPQNFTIKMWQKYVAYMWVYGTQQKSKWKWGHIKSVTVPFGPVILSECSLTTWLNEIATISWKNKPHKIIIIIIIISKFIKHHVCLQKTAEVLVWYRSDSLVTAIKQECLKMSFKTMFRIAHHDFCRQTVPNDRCGVGEWTSCEISGQSRDKQ